MKFVDHLAEMQRDALEGDWDAFDEQWFETCVKLCGEEKAQRIADIDMDSFTDELTESLKEAHALALEQEAAAIYFEYDPDNDWYGCLFICPEYAPIDEGDDDWACDATEEIETASATFFAKHWPDSTDTDEEMGAQLALVARMASSFAQAVSQLPDDDNIAMAIGFHDQDPVLRVRDREEFAVDTDGTSEIDPEMLEGQYED